MGGGGSGLGPESPCSMRPHIEGGRAGGGVLCSKVQCIMGKCLVT